MKAVRWVLLFATLPYCSTILRAQKIPLSDPATLDLRGTTSQVTAWHDHQALALAGKPNATDQLAIIRNTTFHNGTIEIDLAGALSKTADASARGFIGVAFRVQPDTSHYECIYIRPTNAAPRTSSAATTPRSTSPRPTGLGIASVKRAPASTSLTPTWLKASGST